MTDDTDLIKLIDDTLFQNRTLDGSTTDQARAVLAALRREGVIVGKVKPLEWEETEDCDGERFHTTSPLGVDCYYIADHIPTMDGKAFWRLYCAMIRADLPNIWDARAAIAAAQGASDAERSAWEAAIEAAADVVRKCVWGEYWSLDGEQVEPLHVAAAIRALRPPAPDTERGD